MNIPHRILTPDDDKSFSKTLESDSSTEFVTAQNSLADVSRYEGGARVVSLLQRLPPFDYLVL